MIECKVGGSICKDIKQFVVVNCMVDLVEFDEKGVLGLR